MVVGVVCIRDSDGSDSVAWLGSCVRGSLMGLLLAIVFVVGEGVGY